MKKFIYSLMLAFMLIFAVSCKPDDTDSVDVNAVYESIFKDVDVLQVTENLNLPTELEGVTITWQSSHPDVISVTGVVTRGDKTTLVTLTATLSYNGEQVTKTTKVKVPAKEISADMVWAPVATFTVGETYKFGMYQGNTEKTLYLTGEMSGFYMATTENPVDALDVKVVAVEGGYQLETSKGYIEAVTSEDGAHVNGVYSSAPTVVWTYNAEYNTFVTKATKNGEEADYYLGTYSSYGTFGASPIDKAPTSFVGHLYALQNKSDVNLPTDLTDAEKVAADKEALKLAETVTADFALPTTGAKGSVITWAVTEGTAVAIEGNTAKVTIGDEDATVKLTATISSGEESTTKEFTVVVSTKSAEGVATIAEALAAAVGTDITIQGTVSSIYYQWDESYGNMSVKVTDETGTIIAFRITEKVEIGYVIKVTGKIDQYNSVNQIAQGSTVTVISTSVGGEVIKTAQEALSAKLGAKVEIQGEVTEIYQDWDSSYGNMSVYVTDSTGTILAFRITEQVEIGYVIKVAGTISAYNNLNQIAQGSTVTVISTGVELTDAEKVAADKEALELNEEVRVDFNLPEAGAKGATITWVVTEGTAVVIEGNTAKVTRGAEDATVKLTATISSGEESDTKEFTVVVKSQQTSSETLEVTYTFSTTSTKMGTELNADTALALFKASTSDAAELVSVETTKVYDGNGQGGAYANQAGFLKMGTSKVNGELTLTFAEGVEVSKVEISCHDWFPKTDSFPTNSNKVTVNGSAEVLAPYNTEGTPEVLTFDLNGGNTIKITSALRIFVFSIKVTYTVA